MNVFPKYIAVQSRVSRFSWSLYSAQTLDQVSCWRSKICFAKFIRTQVLANQNRERDFFCARKKNDTYNQISQRCVSLAPNFHLFLRLCRLQRARFASCLAEIQREVRMVWYGNFIYTRYFLQVHLHLSRSRLLGASICAVPFSQPIPVKNYF